MLKYTTDHVEELAAPHGGWQVPAVRRWVSAAVDMVADALPHRSVYCSGNPIHPICIGYDPQTKRPCSCSCHSAKRAADLSD